jgi:hypothetical protein
MCGFVETNPIKNLPIDNEQVGAHAHKISNNIDQDKRISKQMGQARRDLPLPTSPLCWHWHLPSKAREERINVMHVKT